MMSFDVEKHYINSTKINFFDKTPFIKTVVSPECN